LQKQDKGLKQIQERSACFSKTGLQKQTRIVTLSISLDLFGIFLGSKIKIHIFRKTMLCRNVILCYCEEKKEYNLRAST